MNNIDSEGINSISTDIVPENPGDEDLPLVVVAEEPPYHDEVSTALSCSTASAFYPTMWCQRVPVESLEKAEFTTNSPQTMSRRLILKSLNLFRSNNLTIIISN